MNNKIIKNYWSHIPDSLRKIYLIVIELADGTREEVCGTTEEKAFKVAERFYGV